MGEMPSSGSSSNARSNRRRPVIVIFEIYVRESGKVEIYVGDTFKNIGAEANIVNRSNAGPVLRTGRPQAVASRAALQEERVEPAPSKGRLRAWLGSIVASLPSVLDAAAALAKLVGLA